MFSVGSTFYQPIVILYSYFYIFLYFLYFVKILISRPGPPFTEARGEQDGGPGAGHPFLARFGWPEENIVRPPTEIDYFVISITLRKVSFMKKPGFAQDNCASSSRHQKRIMFQLLCHVNRTCSRR